MGNDFERYLQKVIHSLEKATEDEKLLALCGRLDDLTAAQILQSDGDLGGLYREIGKHLAFLKNARYGVRPFDNDDVVRGAETFRTVLFLFEEGIRHCSLVTILKAIFIYQWFDLPYRFLRDNLEANIYIDNELLLTEVNGVISKLKGEMNLPEKIPYGDGKFLEEYEVGVATEDLIKVYSFVSAIEKGAALRLSSILEHFIRFNYVFNLNAIKQHFNQLIEPYEIIIFLSVLQLEGEFPSLVTKETCNPWLIIEVIRQTLRGYETLPSAVISELRGISDHLLALNSVLFFQAIDYFSFYSAYWQYHSVLGALFAGAEVGIITKYVRRFEIKRRPNNYNNDQLFVESFLANHPKGDISAILFCGMYNKWSQWLDKAVEDGTYVQGLVFTNCFSYVVQYSLQRESSLEGIIFELGLCLRNLKKVEYGWFKDEIQQRTAFFASLTRLYLVIVECHFKEINAKLPSAIVEELLATLDDRRLWLRYFDAIEQPHTFMKIRELIR